MRIGIITQPLYTNYGGILQNFALQQILRKMGHSPITLDYLPSLSFGRYLLYAGKGVVCSIFPSWRHPIKAYRHFLKRRPEISAFINNNIATTKTISHYSKKILKKYGIEAILVGSDQVWRYSYTSHYIKDMYLSFAHRYRCPKMTYGASFGIDEWDYPPRVSYKVNRLVNQFDSISVREDSAITLCKEHLAVDAKVVLDPTLLLAASDYEKFCSKPSPHSVPYLAAYILDINEEKKAYINAVAATMGLDIIDMTVSNQGVSIEGWLSAIRNAEFVITDSFHGSLFSIIFQKQFQTILNKERGADRFLTVFGKLGLMSRLLATVPAEPILQDPIDYSPVLAALNRLQEESVLFIQDSLR